MRVLMLFTALFLVSLPPFALSENRGSVCLGPFLSVVWYEPSERPYLTIGEHGPFHFKQENETPRRIVNGLDLKKVYRVRVHFGGKVVRSWNLDFDKLGSDMAYIWRAKGAWRMEPIGNGKCERPQKYSSRTESTAEPPGAKKET